MQQMEERNLFKCKIEKGNNQKNKILLTPPKKITGSVSKASLKVARHSIPEDDISEISNWCVNPSSVAPQNSSPVPTVSTEGHHLYKLKDKTTRLKLDTRRPSYQEWKDKYLHQNQIGNLAAVAKEKFHAEFSEENIRKINSSLSWVRQELREMRHQDQLLAQQLLHIHKVIQSLRLDWSCQEHQLMLEDAKSDLDEIKEIKRVSDLPLHNDKSLNELGFTQMNIAFRKYSVF